jgi:hypothetical protein
MARLASEVKETLFNVAGADFILVELLKGEAVPVYDHSGDLLKFKSGAEASRYAERLSNERGNKVQPRRVNDKDWKSREALRLKDGIYRPLPWIDQKWWLELAPIHKDHFPHVSVQKQALISFTESDEKGSADLQTVIKPGKYFERFFGDKVSDYLVRDLCTIFSAKFEVNEVMFAETADEMEEIYTTGPASCMTKAASAYPTKGIHPVRMYAAGDLAIAYIQREGRVVARAVCWPAKKVYSAHVYGDSGRFDPMMKKLGFSKGGSMDGARLAKFRVASKDAKNMHHFVMPHVDGYDSVTVAKEHLILGRGNGGKNVLTFGGGSGITESCGIVCAKCDAEDLRSRDMANVITDTKGGTQSMWCHDCSKVHAVECMQSGYRVSKDVAVEIDEPKGWMWKRYAETNAVRCSATKKMITRGVAVPDEHGGFWSPSYAKTHKAGYKCPSCGRTRHGRLLCHNCGSTRYER